jgi:valyl-tRNA synthetase
MIDKFGADAVRFGIMISSPAGNDLLFDDTSPEQGMRFNNKIWNALKLIKMWEAKIGNPQSATGNTQFAITWFENKLQTAKAEIEQHYKDFKLSEGLKSIYSLIWDDFCSWYLEWVKPGMDQPIDKAVYDKTISFFTELMQLLHPYMPFITEEIYHLLAPRTEDLCVKQFAPLQTIDTVVLKEGELLKDVITGLRDVRIKNEIKTKEPIKLYIQSDNNELYKAIETILRKQVNIEQLSFVTEPVVQTITAVIDKDKFYIETERPVDTSAQKEQLLKDLEYYKKFLESVNKKLSNERFTQSARPDVVQLEQKKKTDAEEKIKAIEESLSNL